MLIEFNVKNYRSFRGPQTLSMVKAQGDELADTNTFEVSGPNKLELLRSLAIYGPNAAGKSNILKALRAMHITVVKSAGWERGDEIPAVPFRLDNESESLPSEFEVMFITEGVRYQYGFAATTKRIHEEWLMAYPKGHPQKWFQRAWDEKEKKYDWDFGKFLQGDKKLWQRSTRDNALYLSTAVQLNSQQLQPIYDWFGEKLHIGNIHGWSPIFSAKLCETKDKARIVSFLKAADLSIEDVKVTQEKFDPKDLPSDMPDVLRDAIATDMAEKILFEISTLHTKRDGKPAIFDWEDESDGTQKIFSFAGPWIDTLENGYVLFVDELHDNLHPRLVKFLVDLFHDNDVNKKNAQLVFTTHETSILKQDILRRDQVWFCEKDKAESSELYPLTDFSPRKTRENLEAAYRSGRYGASPSVGRFFADMIGVGDLAHGER